MEATNEQNTAHIFEQGARGPADYFTGTVWVSPLVARGGDINYTVSNVVFAPGARTNWHTHPARQILLVTDGVGVYQERGKPARPIIKGDVVNIPADVEHWHGATSNDRLVHVAISNYKDDNNVVWLHPVSGEEYAAVQK